MALVSLFSLCGEKQLLRNENRLLRAYQTRTLDAVAISIFYGIYHSQIVVNMLENNSSKFKY